MDIETTDLTNNLLTDDDVGNAIRHAIGSEIDLGQLALHNNSTANPLLTRRHITIIPVEKPGRQEFIQVHHEHFLETAVLEIKEERENYLIAPELWQKLPGELTPKVIYLTINRDEVIKLWPIRLPDAEGKLDDWNQSALDGAEIAKGSWVRISSNLKAGMYEIHEATGTLEQPEWPDKTFDEIIKIAFKGKYIDSWEHPVLRKLRGEL